MMRDPSVSFRWLRIFLIAQWSLGLIAFSLALITPEFLPDEIVTWMDQQFSIDENTSGLRLIVLATFFLSYFILSIAYLVACVGLFFRQYWAAWLYVLSAGILYLLLPFTGWTVSHGLEYTVNSLASICVGAVVVLVFFAGALSTNEKTS